MSRLICMAGSERLNGSHFMWDTGHSCCVESVSFWGLTESLVHFSPGYLDKFSQEKINFIGSSQTWYQMKGREKIRGKA